MRKPFLIRPKAFFFWGRNRSKELLIERVKEVPIRFIDARYGKLTGKLADFSNLSDEEFLMVLGRLACIEWCYYTLNKISVVTDEKKYDYAWIYVEIPYHLVTIRLDDMRFSGSRYCNGNPPKRMRRKKKK